MKYASTLLFFCISWALFGQNNILEKPITIKLQSHSIAQILDIISETNGFYFSYNPSLINTKTITNIHAENKAVKEVLDKLFNQTANFQQISNHIIIKPKPIVQEPKVKNNKPTLYYYNISGYLREEYGGLGLSQISVYEKQMLAATLSEDFGFYELKFSTKEPEAYIQFSSPMIEDTMIKVFGKSQPAVNDLSFQLQMRSKPMSLINSLPPPDSIGMSTIKTDSLSKLEKLAANFNQKIDSLKLTQRVSSSFQNISLNNIRDSFHRNWQASFFPPFGTNGQRSPLITNKISFNMLVGYHNGVDALEIGGFINLIRKNVNGVQIAGFGNAVGGNLNGAQIAGFFNHNLANFKGTQIGGFYNYNKGNTKGLQIAGFTNYAKNVNGMQIAGFLNRAKTMKGVQLGFINIADTLNGVGIGFFNYVKSGLHQLELTYNYAKDFQIGFRSGTDQFYTHFDVLAATSNKTNDPWLGFGYGVGHNFKINKAFLINLEMQSHQVTKGFRIDYLTMINQLKLNLEIRPIKGVAIFGGTGLANTLFESNDPNLVELKEKYGYQYEYNKNGRLQVNVNPTWQLGVRFF